MANEIKTQGMEVFVVDPSATGSEIIKLGNVTEIGPIGGEPAKIDATDLDSVRRVSIPGLEADERFTVTIKVADGDAGHEFLEDNAGSLTEYQVIVADSTGSAAPTYSAGVVLPTDRNSRSFDARIAMFQLQGATVDGLLMAQVGFDIVSDVAVNRPA